jgi:hypothetical protein
MAFTDRPSLDRAPDDWWRVYGTRRAASQSIDMICVRVRQDDRVWPDAINSPQPVGATIDHDRRATM